MNKYLFDGIEEQSNLSNEEWNKLLEAFWTEFEECYSDSFGIFENENWSNKNKNEYPLLPVLERIQGNKNLLNMECSLGLDFRERIEGVRRFKRERSFRMLGRIRDGKLVIIRVE